MSATHNESMPMQEGPEPTLDSLSHDQLPTEFQPLALLISELQLLPESTCRHLRIVILGPRLGTTVRRRGWSGEYWWCHHFER